MLAPSRRPALPLFLSAAVFGVLVLESCGGGAPGPGAATPTGTASDAEWRALATPRPQPVDGAPRVALDQVEVLANVSWGAPGVDANLGVTELAAAGLLRRQDVQFVERRRFSAAADAERAGRARPAGAPRAGTSPGAQYRVDAKWASVGVGQGNLELRISNAETSEILRTLRVRTPEDADAASVARAVVGGALVVLDSLGVLPSWTDPMPMAAPSQYESSGVPAAATQAFFRGLAAEEQWDWEAARRGYQAAIAAAGGTFPEARAALARTARLRNGGTLGEG